MEARFEPILVSGGIKSFPGRAHYNLCARGIHPTFQVDVFRDEFYDHVECWVGSSFETRPPQSETTFT